jgi:ribosomal protein L22
MTDKAKDNKADEAEAAEKPKRARRRKPADKKETAAAAKAESKAETGTTAEAKPKRRAKAASKPKDEAEAEKAPARKARAAKADADAPAKAKPETKRKAVEPGAAPPVVRAHAKYVRSSARKARLVCDHIRGKSVEDARAILEFAPRAVARDWSKLLESAVANAEHNHELIGDELRVRDVFADEGPTLKRYRPRAMGRATPIRKRTSHLTITLTPKE